MPTHASMKKSTETQLARYERILNAATVMTDQEKSDLLDWEKKNLTGDGLVATSDWPGWESIIHRMSH